MVYPEIITNRLADLPHARQIAEANAVGTGVSFSCGSFVRFSFVIDVETSLIVDACFKSNGCGFMLASADIFAKGLINIHLTELHGLVDDDLRQKIRANLGENLTARQDCIDCCIQALRSALADFRESRIEEFIGEKALICTCFGVTEERIETIIRENSIESVDEVSAKCNAGLGCGSCRMMIEEMIDGHNA